MIVIRCEVRIWLEMLTWFCLIYGVLTVAHMHQKPLAILWHPNLRQSVCPIIQFQLLFNCIGFSSWLYGNPLSEIVWMLSRGLNVTYINLCDAGCFCLLYLFRWIDMDARVCQVTYILVFTCYWVLLRIHKAWSRYNIEWKSLFVILCSGHFLGRWEDVHVLRSVSTILERL